MPVREIFSRQFARATECDPRGPLLGTARTLLALADLSVLAFTADRDLFLRETATVTAGRCDGVRSLSLWCLAGPHPAALLVCRVVAILVFAVVATGFRPRWTCIPHWYLAFSMGTAMTVANGGEGVDRIVTLLLIPLCLGDTRTWQWRCSGPPLGPGWRGSAYVALLFVRAQVIVVYLNSAVAKVMTVQWRNGSAFAGLLDDPYYGAPHWIRGLLGPLFSAGPAAVVLG